MSGAYIQDFDIEKFITLIKEQGFIYDPRDPKHCNRFLVSTTWKNIAKEMNSTEKLCRSKWTTLRSNYVRELRKHNDPSSPPKTKWPYFDILDFLQPYIKSRIPSESTSGVDFEEDHSLSEGSIKQEDFIEQKSWFETSPTEIPIKSKRLEYLPQNEPKRLREGDEDDDKYFLLSILPQMRQLAPRDNLIFRMEVQQLLINKLYPQCVSE